MTTETILLTAFIPAEPARVFEAWLSTEATEAFTGSPAAIEVGLGGRYSAWDGYINAVNRALVQGRRIQQSWRANDFPESAPDSLLELHFDPEEGGTHLTLLHDEVPLGRGKDLEQGWLEFYIEPLKEYFGGPTTEKKSKVAKKPAPKKSAREPVPKVQPKSAKIRKPLAKKAKAAAKRPAPAKRSKTASGKPV
jgi:uncharacterized protein YndB with AHSA1/START domain